MDPQPDVAAVAAHFAERSRARMLLELIDGTARPASHLARAAGVSASTASAHLARLEASGLVEVEARGRHRRFRIADERVVVVLEALIPLAATPAPAGLRVHSHLERLRVARTCYDHLAGTLGTDVLAGLVERGALVRLDGVPGSGRGPDDALSAPVATAPYRLGDPAQELLGELGIDLAALDRARRPLLRACVDWTEQRHHLAGGLGAAIAAAFVDRGWVERREGRRDLAVRDPASIARWLTGTASGATAQ
ncbi:ArsR/SmtB family transcription factor [Brachybacterium huguangmaarense]